MDEQLPDVTDNFVGGYFEYVEVNGLGKRSAFADQGNVSDLAGEGGRDVGDEVFVSLLVPVVFWDVVEVVFPHDNGALHFIAEHDSLENSASDGDVAGEGAFLIDIVALDGILGCFEVESDVLEIPDS